MVDDPTKIISNVLFQTTFWVSLNNIQDLDIESVQSIKSFEKFVIAAFKLHLNNNIKVLHCLLIKQFDNFILIFNL